MTGQSARLTVWFVASSNGELFVELQSTHVGNQLYFRSCNNSFASELATRFVD